MKACLLVRPHQRGNIAGFLLQQEAGSAVALETVGNWCWIVDEIERAGMRPVLVHAGKAKLMMGCINKTDKLDAKGLNMLQRVGRLPTVCWRFRQRGRKRDVVMSPLRLAE